MEKKMQLIKDNKDVVIMSLNKYLDIVYDLTDKYFNQDGSLKEGLTQDEKLVNFIKDTRTDANNFEQVRRKVIDDNYDLSLVEINYIVISFLYVQNVWNNEIEKLQKAKTELADFISKLTGKNID